MNFLYPGFLFALISVAIPVIIHLFNFRKFKKIYFSNVQLLKEVEQQNSSIQSVKNILVLLARVLAIVFLVAAFAQPYIPEKQSPSKFLNNVVSVYVDNSYSMEAVNSDGNLLEEAKRKAKEITEDFGINDRYQLLTNDFEGKHQRLQSRDQFLKALDDVKISGFARSLQQVVDKQATLMNGAFAKYAFVISDFQKNFVQPTMFEVKPEIHYSLVKLNASFTPNIAIDSVWSLSPNHQPGGAESLVVQVKNYSDVDAKSVPIKLTINNQQKGLTAISVGAGKTRRDTISFSGLLAGWQKGIFTLKDFPITFDDTLAFAFNVNEHKRILNIKGENANRYVDAVFSTENYFKVAEQSENKINYSSIGNYELIILNQLKNPSSGLVQQLKKYLADGGSVVIFPDLDADISDYNLFLSGLTLPRITGLNLKEARVDKIDFNHPIFRTVFEQIPKKVDLPLIKRYFSFLDQNKSTRESILEFADGQSLFSKFNIGHGQIYLSSTALGDNDGNFARHPLFVPLMFKLALNRTEEQPFYYNLGDENAFQSKQIQLGKNDILKLHSKHFEVIPELRNVNGKTFVYLADQIKNAGFYELKLRDSLLSVYALNIGRSESDMHYFSKSDLDKLAVSKKLKVFDAKTDSIKLISGDHKIKQTLWKLCLILALVFIAIEILLIRFFNHSKKLT